MVRPWLSVLTSFHNTPVFGRLWESVAALTVYSAGVVLVDRLWLGIELGVGAQFHGVLGLILGTLLVFRTNTSYDRWWEGRKLWGQLVNDSRNLAIKVRTLVEIDRQEMRHFGRLVVNFSLALKEHLREGVNRKQLSVFRDLPFEPKHVPAHGACLI